jgi:hypothetical protein
LEVALKEVRGDKEVALFEGKKVDVQPDWRLVQTRLLPEVLLVMGTVYHDGGNKQYPALAVVPEMGEFWRVTSDVHLDVLKRDLDSMIENDRSSTRALEADIARIPEKNGRHKAMRLLGEISKLIGD